jgi:hypothetical protein
MSHSTETSSEATSSRTRTGAFHKQLLDHVTQEGDNGADFYTHRFDYFPETLGFGQAADWDTGGGADNDKVGWTINDKGAAEALQDALKQYLPTYGRASALGGSVTDGLGGHIYVGFNPEFGTKTARAVARSASTTPRPMVSWPSSTSTAMALLTKCFRRTTVFGTGPTSRVQMAARPLETL